MQAHFNRKYDLRSLRKRTRTQDQEEDAPHEEASTQKETLKTPQSFPASTCEDSREEATEDIQPPDQLVQETEGCCSFVCVRKEILPSTEEEIDWI